MMLRDDIASLAASCHEAVLSIAILALLYLWNFFLLTMREEDAVDAKLRGDIAQIGASLSERKE